MPAPYDPRQRSRAARTAVPLAPTRFSPWGLIWRLLPPLLLATALALRAIQACQLPPGPARRADSSRAPLVERRAVLENWVKRHPSDTPARLRLAVVLKDLAVIRAGDASPESARRETVAAYQERLSRALSAAPETREAQELALSVSRDARDAGLRARAWELLSRIEAHLGERERQRLMLELAALERRPGGYGRRTHTPGGDPVPGNRAGAAPGRRGGDACGPTHL